MQRLWVSGTIVIHAHHDIGDGNQLSGSTLALTVKTLQLQWVFVIDSVWESFTQLQENDLGSSARAGIWGFDS